jgi:hypothetical protein
MDGLRPVPSVVTRPSSFSIPFPDESVYKRRRLGDSGHVLNRDLPTDMDVSDTPITLYLNAIQVHKGGNIEVDPVNDLRLNSPVFVDMEPRLPTLREKSYQVVNASSLSTSVTLDTFAGYKLYTPAALNFHLAKLTASATKAEEVPTPEWVANHFKYLGVIGEDDHKEGIYHYGKTPLVVRGGPCMITDCFPGAGPMSQLFWVIKWVKAPLHPMTYRETNKSIKEGVNVRLAFELESYPYPGYFVQIQPCVTKRSFVPLEQLCTKIEYGIGATFYASGIAIPVGGVRRKVRGGGAVYIPRYVKRSGDAPSEGVSDALMMRSNGLLDIRMCPTT